jgi:hypothetical protein
MPTVERKNWSTVTRRRAFAAAVPLFLFGLCVAAITLFLLAIGGPAHVTDLGGPSLWHTLALVIGALAFVALGVAAILCARRCLPVWSYTWIGSGMTGCLVALNLVVEDRGTVLSPVIDIAVLALYLLSGLLTYGTVAMRGWQHAGLFSLGLCATLGLSLSFFAVAGPFQTYLGGIAALLGLVDATLVYAYVRRTSAVRVAVLVGVGIGNLGVAWMVERTFRSLHPSRGISQFWLLAALLTGLLVGGTLVGLPARFVRQALGRERAGRQSLKR